LRQLPGLGVQGLDDVGVCGRDRLAPEFHGGVISPPPGCQEAGEMANRLICSARDSLPFAVWTARRSE